MTKMHKTSMQWSFRDLAMNLRQSKFHASFIWYILTNENGFKNNPLVSTIFGSLQTLFSGLFLKLIIPLHDPSYALVKLGIFVLI